MDTNTTNVSMVNPRIIGLNPILRISLKLVLSPIADSAITIQNLDVFELASTKASGNRLVLRRATTAKNNRIKKGKIFFRFTAERPCWIFDLFSSRLVMTEKISTHGIINKVRVSFTITAVFPAADEKA